ncbi:DUF1707 domain-containing protein [Microlunatus elymi]|uniref:DUF1707 domain-containing protein n=1 Tax=Microlunatus elymi TaxID=2596828 RepID=A0A516PXN6_9ACTN|nr:DUF1707 domain-containing protein [Microlunatus elymi]QDP95938.1 DUF1707 domain-containing protein [Microlunatus elymi]
MIISMQSHSPGRPGPAHRPGFGELTWYGGERIGDVERSATCDALADHFAAGRLGSEDLEYRLNLAVQAVTRDDLLRLTADLPASGPSAAPTVRQPTPGGLQPPRSWPAMSVLAALGLIGSLLIAGGMLIVLGLVSPVLFLGACVGGLAAAVGGASAGYLLQQHVRLRRPDEPERR